jgi:hypothetical protein
MTPICGRARHQQIVFDGRARASASDVSYGIWADDGGTAILQKTFRIERGRRCGRSGSALHQQPAQVATREISRRTSLNKHNLDWTGSSREQL